MNICKDCNAYDSCAWANPVVEEDCRACSLYQPKEAVPALEEVIGGGGTMSRQYRGLKIPDGLNKYSARELSLTDARCVAAGTQLDCDASFCPGINCADCICVREHRKELKELLKMWNEEEIPIKPGMVVKYEREKWCLVYKIGSDNIRGWVVSDNTAESGSKLCELGNYVSVPLSSIDKAYKFRADTMPHGEAVYSLTGNYTGWRRFWRDVELPVLELTVKDIEKKYGRKVKIIGEKND